LNLYHHRSTELIVVVIAIEGLRSKRKSIFWLVYIDETISKLGDYNYDRSLALVYVFMLSLKSKQQWMLLKS